VPLKVNGTVVPYSIVIPMLMFIFWLGGLSVTVFANEDHQEKHEEQPGHTETMTDLAAVKADLKNVKESVERIERQQTEDKNEILRAIREEQ